MMNVSLLFFAVVIMIKMDVYLNVSEYSQSFCLMYAIYTTVYSIYKLVYFCI